MCNRTLICRIVHFVILLIVFFAIRSTALAGDNIALLVGISQYRDIPCLAFADEDVKTFSSILTSYAGYDKRHINLILNDKATKEKIQSSVEDIVKASQKNPLDHFIFMFAGHGLPAKFNAQKTNSFLAPYNADTDQFFPEGGGMVGNESFISKAWLIKQLSSIKAKSVLLILDSCYSGAKDFGELFAENLGMNVKYDVGGGLSRGLAVVRKQSGNMVIDRQIAFISSSRDDQPSAEYPELRHGALSYCIFNYIGRVRSEVEEGTSREISVNELYDNINQLFDQVKVENSPLSARHQPVMFPIPSYENVKGMRFVAVQGNRPQPPKIVSPEIKQVPRTGILEIKSTPENAEVFVDGVSISKRSNCTLELQEGKHLISLQLPETNYEQSFIVDITRGRHQKREISLRGKLAVYAYDEKKPNQEIKVDVYIDGKRFGTSELEKANLVAGSHTLMVKYGGETKERRIEIRPDSPLKVRYKIVWQAAGPKANDSGVDDVVF